MASEPEEPRRRRRARRRGAGRADGSTDAERRCASRAVAARRRCPAARDVGTLVHRVLEATDFAAPRPRRPSSPAASRERAAAAPVDIGDPAAVVAGLRARDRDAARARCSADVRLRDVAPRRPARRARLRAAARRRRRRRPARSRSARSAPSLRDAPAARRPAGRLRRAARATRAAPASLRGYLTGSIDLVVRLPGGAPRFAVVDYKTNWLGGRRRGADRLALPPGRAGRPRCSARTTRCRRCSTWSRCTATCAGGCPATTPTAHLGRRALPVPARHGRPGHAARRRRPCGVFAWRPPARARRRAERRARPRGPA